VFETAEPFGFSDYGNFGDNFLMGKSYKGTHGQPFAESYTYTFNKTGAEPYTTLTNRREFSIVESNKNYNTSTPISKTKIDYATVPTVDIFGNSVTSQIFPQKFSEAKGSNALEEKLIIDKYDIDGNILKAHKVNGNYFYYYYAYGNQYPIAMLEGSSLTDENAFSSQLTGLRTLVEMSTPDNTQIVQKQNIIRQAFPNHMITFYTFKPNVGVTSITQPNGITEYYKYDSKGRLIEINDNDNKKLKDFYYELKN
jgi:YD repeat-containing protein